MKYGILRRLKRGIRLDVMPSYKCNRNCSYCILKEGGDQMPTSEEQNFIYWAKYIETFPLKISEIYLSGGEPSIYPNVDLLVNYFLENKICVTVFTNLMDIKLISKITPSDRLRFSATHHIDLSHDDARTFAVNLELMSMKYRVDVDSFEYREEERLLDLKTEIDDTIKPNHLRASPTGIIFRTCAERNKHFLTKKR